MLSFSKIDTQEKAYLLGFIAADGHVRDYTMSIDLSYKDRRHLTKVAKALDCGRTPTDREVTYKSRSGEVKTAKQSCLAVHSKKLCDELKSHGLLHNKTLTLRPPKNVPGGLLHHYIRGYFDGDGHVGLPETNRLTSFNVQIAGTRWINEWIAGHFREVYPNEAEVRDDKESNCTRLRFGGFTAGQFCRWIYSGSSIHMNRKHHIARGFFTRGVDLVPERKWLLTEEYTLLKNLSLGMDDLVLLLPAKTRRAIYNKKSRYVVSQELSVP